MSVHPEDNPVEGLNQFFEYIWGTQEGWVYLPYKTQSGDWKKVMFQWPKYKRDVVTHTLAQTAESNDIYFAPVLFTEPRPIKENVLGSHVLWADFDGTIPESYKLSDSDSTTPETSITQGIPSPSLRVQSSTNDHQHVYWRLNEFERDSSWIENSNRSIAYSLKADTSGWDIGQVLRPPGTTNYKHGLPVGIIVSNDVVYGRDSFGTLPAVKQLVSEALDLEELPDVTRVVAKYSFDEDHYRLFMQPTIEEGHRSSALMKIGFFGAESGMSDAEIYSLLLNADSRWGKFVNRSDRKRRLLDIVNRARIKYPTGLKVGAGLLRELNKNTPVEQPKYVFGFEEFLNSEINIEWAFENMLEVGGIGMVSAPPGKGKTQISLQFGIAAALGIPFLKWKPIRRMKILVLSLEMSHPSLKWFITSIARQYSQQEIQQLERNLKIVPLGEPLPFDRPEGKKFLEALLDEYKPDGVIVDSMGKVSLTSLSEESKIKELNAYYVHLRNKYGCFLWFIHHSRKATDNNKRPTDLSDVYGNQYITAETTFVGNLWQEKDGSLTFSTLKCRLAPEPAPFTIERNSNLFFTVVEAVGKGLVSSITGNMEDKSGSNGTTNSRDLFDV